MWRLLLELVGLVQTVGWLWTWVWWIVREIQGHYFPRGLQNILSLCLTKLCSLFLTWPFYQWKFRNS